MMKARIQSQLFPGSYPAPAVGVTSNYRHPAVRAYREICSYKPNQIQRELIVNTVTDDPRAVSLYREVLAGFMAEGRPPQRVDWTLERFAEARPRPVGRNDDSDGAELEIREWLEIGDWPAAPIDNEIWRQALAFVQAQISAESYSVWFAPVVCTRVDSEQRAIHLVAPHVSAARWIRANYITLVEDSLTAAGIGGYEVLWTVAKGSDS